MDYDFAGDPETFEQLLIDLHVCHQHLVALLCIILTEILQCSTTLFTKHLHIPHHTSILTGKAWVLEFHQQTNPPLDSTGQYWPVVPEPQLSQQGT